MPPEIETGRVRLVGAGPGAADLMTVRAMHAVQGAEALLYDALVSDEVLALAPAACLKIQTGKRAGRASLRQETINRLMLRLARRGLDVVRLKGGDPSVFGRVGEEAAFLRAHGVAVEVVPGVTAASAAAAQFGFPLTHRGEARRLMLVTGTTRDAASAPELAAAADPQTTLALYMGRRALAQAAEALVAAGRPPATPVLAVENAGRQEAYAVRASLGDLSSLDELADAEGPVLFVIGEVTSQATVSEASRAGRRQASV
jgi:uroporphyrin-III C-methyltransferase